MHALEARTVLQVVKLSQGGEGPYPRAHSSFVVIQDSDLTLWYQQPKVSLPFVMRKPGSRHIQPAFGSDETSSDPSSTWLLGHVFLGEQLQERTLESWH